MSAAAPTLTAIDAALAKGAWWMRLFADLSKRGLRRAEALNVENRKGLGQVVDDFDRIARAMRLAIVAVLRLRGFLDNLARLRKLSPGDLAAARARAKARAEAEAAARQTARDKARVRRVARKSEVRERVVAIINREKPDQRDRDPLVEALDKCLAVDPLLVDLDDLPLRETVMRVCADLGITPDWSGWESADFTTPTPARTQKRLSPPVPPVLQGLPGLTPWRTDTAISRVLSAGSHVRPWRPPRPG